MKSLPIKVLFIYIISTMLISFWGPMEYYNYEKFPVFIYISLFLFFLLAGYFLANRYKLVLWKSSNKFQLTNNIIIKNKIKILKFLSIVIFIAFLSIFFEFINILINNPSLLVPQNMASNYLAVRESFADNGSYSFVMLFRFSTGFFRNISIILGFYYWNAISKKAKVFFVLFLVLLIIVNMVAYGTQKFLGDIIIYAIIVLAIKRLDVKKVNRKSKRKIIVIVFLLLFIMVILFSYVQSQRYELIGVTVFNFGEKSALQSFNTDHIIFKIFGYKFGLGFAILLTGYLSAGYYGLALCLQLPFEWTYGIGNSYVLSKFGTILLGIPNVYEKTYLNRMMLEFGRDGLKSWNTIFPWLASDFTFVGALILFLFVGYVWQTAWLEILHYRNPVSIVLFATISLGFIFIPANNQLFSGLDAYFSTNCIILYWILKHKKYNIIS